MSLPHKGSRKVEVDGVHYRWMIRRKPTYSQALKETPMTLAIEPCDAAGKLTVSLGVSRPDNWLDSHQTSVTPKVVAEIIREAVVAGWDSDDPRAFSFCYQLIRDRC